ncbi:MAG TPA: RDD family protein [Acetobacteraceae bacterium]|nr:RDD family protein [Acetobacteraceae bacterium]
MSEEGWFYLEHGEAQGPVDDLGQPLRENGISNHTLVWRLGQDRWRPLQAVSPHQSRSAVGWTDARPHPWRRYFARTFDLVVNGALSWALLGIILYIVAPAAGPDLLTSAGDNTTIAGILNAALVLPLNAVFIGCTGGTLGKWLIGVRVLAADGDVIGFVPAFRRECAVWLRGLGLCIPVIAILTCVNAYKNLKRNGSVSWDQNRAFEVVHRDAGTQQVVGCITALLIAVVTLAGLTSLTAK